MITDIKIKDYYFEFIRNANNNIKLYTNKLNKLNNNIIDIKNVISQNIDNINKDYNINLNEYEEWVNTKHKEHSKLYDKVTSLIKLTSVNREILITLAKYCSTLRLIYLTEKELEYDKSKLTLTYTNYVDIVRDYYNKVQEFILKGCGYKYNAGIGIFYIEKAQLRGTKTIIDFNATNKRKKELLSKGVNIINRNEESWYKERNIPYNAEDYRVYRRDSFAYLYRLIKSRILPYKETQLEKLDYINSKYRGMSYQDIADKCCNKAEDVFDMQLDLKTKLMVMLKKDPVRHLIFEKDGVHKHRKNYSQNR